MDNHAKPLSGKRIGIFGKGGAGKSTMTVFLAWALNDRGYEVCVLDADSTNIGLARALGCDKPPIPLMEYFGGMVFRGGLVTCPVDDPAPLLGSDISLQKLPPRYSRKSQSGITLLVAGKIGDQGPGAGCDGPVAKIARDLRIQGRSTNLVTLVDFKAGFEDTARGVVTSLDWAVILIDPTVAAVEMACNMKDMVDQIKAGGLPATQHLEDLNLVAIANQLFSEASIKGTFFLLNKISNAGEEAYLRKELRERGIEPDGIIHEEPSISVSWLRGNPLDVKNLPEDILGVITKLEAAESS
jgi:CO dehydrogenase nickel-insertion accessory protein CooC1